MLLALSPWTGTQARALPLGTDRVVRFRLGRSALGEDERRRCVCSLPTPLSMFF